MTMAFPQDRQLHHSICGSRRGAAKLQPATHQLAQRLRFHRDQTDFVFSFAREFEPPQSAARRIQLNLRDAAMRALIDEKQRRLADKAEE